MNLRDPSIPLSLPCPMCGAKPGDVCRILASGEEIPPLHFHLTRTRKRRIENHGGGNAAPTPMRVKPYSRYRL